MKKLIFILVVLFIPVVLAHAHMNGMMGEQQDEMGQQGMMGEGMMHMCMPMMQQMMGQGMMMRDMMQMMMDMMKMQHKMMGA